MHTHALSINTTGVNKSSSMPRQLVSQLNIAFHYNASDRIALILKHLTYSSILSAYISSFSVEDG